MLFIVIGCLYVCIYILHKYFIHSCNAKSFSDASVLHSRITGHSNAVWGLTINGSKMLSCSADGTVKLWDTENNTGLLNTFSLENGLYHDILIVLSTLAIIIHHA
jgi:WD40 repeat protein